jgi:hypothetical protein
MKQLLVANFQPTGKCKFNELENLVKAQIDNSRRLKWSPKDIILVTNFHYEYRGVKAQIMNTEDFCLTGSKMFGIKWVFENLDIPDDEVIWTHDLDAWQNEKFEEPEFKDVGACEYSRPKFNGGSIFWRKSAKDIIDEVVKQLINDKAKREEPTLDKVFKSETYKSRITILNYTYNVGCSGYIKRLLYSEQPVKVLHFHPTNRIAVQTHVLDRNGMGIKTINKDLEKILRRYWPSMQKELDEDGKKARAEKIEARAKTKYLEKEIDRYLSLSPNEDSIPLLRKFLNIDKNEVS